MRWERCWLEIGDIAWELGSTVWENPPYPTSGLEWVAVFPVLGTQQLAETVDLEYHPSPRSGSESTIVSRKPLLSTADPLQPFLYYDPCRGSSRTTKHDRIHLGLAAG